MSKLLIYPINRNSSALVRYKKMIKQFDSIVYVAARGNGYNGKDASILDNGQKLDIEITEDYEGELSVCDTVLFLDTEEDLNINLYYEKICEAEKLMKRIFISNIVYKCLEHKNLVISTNVRIIGNDIDNQASDNIISENKYIKKMDVPVLAIIGMGNECNKFDLQLDTKNYFQERGYNVLTFGTKEFSELFNCYNLPRYIFDSQMTLSEKILNLNNYFYDVIRKEKPDLCIIGIPGGVVPLDNYFYNYFAEIPYIISNAITADVSILSTYFFPSINNAFLSNLKEHIRHKFNYIVDYYHLSNVAYSIDTSDDEPEICYLHNNYEKVEKVIDSNKLYAENVFNVFSDKRKRVYENIEKELSGHIEII